MEIILSEESGWVDLQQAVGRLINAIVAVTGPELAPGSLFFSRCKVKVMPYVVPLLAFTFYFQYLYFLNVERVYGFM